MKGQRKLYLDRKELFYVYCLESYMQEYKWYSNAIGYGLEYGFKKRYYLGIF